jgi:hypothetical protein
MTWVFYNARLRPVEKLVLLAIADNADDNGANAWPSVATLSRKACVDSRTVQRTVKKLVHDGWLTVWPGAGPAGTNRYAILMPTVDQVAAASARRVHKAVDGVVDNPGAGVGKGAAPRRGGTRPGVAQRTKRVAMRRRRWQLCRPNVL